MIVELSHVLFFSLIIIIIIIIIIIVERSGLKAGIKIESAESKVVDSLRDHCTYDPEAQTMPQMYTRVLSLLPMVHNLSQHMISRVHLSISEHKISIPKQICHLFSQNLHQSDH